MNARRICEETGKVRYRSLAESRRAMARFGGRIRAYRCCWCGGVHVTTQQPDDRRSYFKR